MLASLLKCADFVDVYDFMFIVVINDKQTILRFLGGLRREFLVRSTSLPRATFFVNGCLSNLLTKINLYI